MQEKSVHLLLGRLAPHIMLIYMYRSLNHPNLLSLLGTIQRPHSIILIMNYVRGRSLHTIIFDSDDMVCCLIYDYA